MNTTGARGSAFDSVITKIRSRWMYVQRFSVFANQQRFAISTYSTCVCSLMLYRSECSVKEEDAIRLEGNNVRMIGWKCNVRSEGRTSAEELRAKLKLNSI